MITDLFFDFDGTLVDSKEAITFGISKTILHGMGVSDYNLPTHLIGKGFNDVFRHDFNEITDEKITELINIYRNIYDNETYHMHVLYPDVEEVLGSLKQKYRLHVLSLKEQSILKKLCDHFNITYLFDNIYGPTQEHEEKIDTFRKKIGELNLVSEQCLLIGDSSSDYHAANGLNANFIYAKYGFGILENYSGNHINNFSELLLKV